MNPLRHINRKCHFPIPFLFVTHASWPVNPSKYKQDIIPSPHIVPSHGKRSSNDNKQRTHSRPSHGSSTIRRGWHRRRIRRALPGARPGRLRPLGTTRRLGPRSRPVGRRRAHYVTRVGRGRGRGHGRFFCRPEGVAARRGGGALRRVLDDEGGRVGGAGGARGVQDLVLLVDGALLDQAGGNLGGEGLLVGGGAEAGCVGEGAADGWEGGFDAGDLCGCK